MQLHDEFYLGMAPSEYLDKKSRHAHWARLLTAYSVGRNLSLMSCSPAELISVSVPSTKFKMKNYIYNLLNFPATYTVN
jgi:hypothetical protein